MKNASIDGVRAFDMDMDGHPEIQVTLTTYYGDGSYTDVYFLHGKPGADRPRLGTLSVSGSSGEPGGSEVGGDWWASPPRIYSVFAQEGNDAAEDRSHDLRVEAHEFTPSGEMVPVKDPVFHAVLFGRPGYRRAADSLAASLMATQPMARVAGLHALPRKTKAGIRWQAGTIAPDAKTAKAWARWHKSGVVKRVKSR